MKAYKIRSLIYLTCFITAAVVYYHIEEKELLESSILTSQTADIQAEDSPEEELISDKRGRIKVSRLLLLLLKTSQSHTWY